LAAFVVKRIPLRPTRENTYFPDGDADRLTFIGQCGTYRYLDLDQVINQSLREANEWLRRQNLAAIELKDAL
jgi:UDP-galactopyranose mutase